MNHKTYAPSDMTEEGCWFSVDLVDENGAEAVLSCIDASSDDDAGEWTEEHLAECKRLAYLTAIYEADKIGQDLREGAREHGIDTSHIVVLSAVLESGGSLDAADRAWRQGFIFNHSGQVQPVPPLTGN